MHITCISEAIKINRQTAVVVIQDANAVSEWGVKFYCNQPTNRDSSSPRLQWLNYVTNFGPPANIRYGLTVSIHNSGHFVPPLPFWAPGPPAIAGAADG